jgi:hypothetical protein
MDANEERYMAVANIPGAFLHADMEHYVHMILEGTIEELNVKLEPKPYRKYIWKNETRKPMLYINFKKALYRTLQMALSGTLIEWGQTK